MEKYKAKEDRYDKMQYRRCGKSGILLPLISLGLWQQLGPKKTTMEFSAKSAITIRGIN